MSQYPIKVVGPRDARASYADLPTIFTVSRAEDWQRELSPFHLGAVPLYDGTSARCLEGAWQFAKCYAQHLAPNGAVLPAYWSWARRGWSSHAVRYPMGKGAKPEFCLWDGRRLGYVDARKHVYWRLYRDAVRKTGAWRRLAELHSHGPMSLWDFDGFDHDSQGMPLSAVIEQTKRPMGHAFVLKAMLLYGADIEADEVAQIEAATKQLAAPQSYQFELFDQPHDLATPARATHAKRP